MPTSTRAPPVVAQPAWDDADDDDEVLYVSGDVERRLSNAIPDDLLPVCGSSETVGSRLSQFFRRWLLEKPLNALSWIVVPIWVRIRRQSPPEDDDDDDELIEYDATAGDATAAADGLRELKRRIAAVDVPGRKMPKTNNKQLLAEELKLRLATVSPVIDEVGVGRDGRVRFERRRSELRQVPMYRTNNKGRVVISRVIDVRRST